MKDHANSQHDARSDAAMADACLVRPWWFLEFPEPLEARFRRQGLHRRLETITAFGGLAIAFFLALVLPDLLMTPSVMPVSLWMRLVVFPAVVIAGLWWIRRHPSPRALENMVAMAGMLAAALEVGILYAAQHMWAYPRVVELNIVVVFVCAIARFRPAVYTCLFVLAMHVVASAVLPDPTSVLGVSTTVLLVTTIAFSLSAAFKLERDERLAFLMDVREQALEAELQQANERLAKVATTDPLTGVPNRRAFDAFLADSWSRSTQERRPLGLIMLDIDWFKRYNDLHGHQAGDRCLMSVAQAAQTCLRRTGDLVARLGGEEFAVVMADADAAAVSAAAERIRQAVSQLALPHGASPFQVVTVSVGLSALAGADVEPAYASPQDLVAAADEALYQAKQRGRNRVADAAWQEQAA